MSKDGYNSQDELNANHYSGSKSFNNSEKSTSESKTTTEPPKENPFSFKHFLRQDTSANSNSINSNEPNTSNNSIQSTGAKPKVPQFYSSNSMQSNQADSRMKRSPKFSSFDSQSSLSELTEERNMHSSRSNNCFNLDYQFPSSRSYSNYHLEPNTSSTSSVERKQNHNFVRRSQNNGSNNVNSINSLLPDFVQDHLLMESYYDQNNENLSPVTNDAYSLENCNNTSNQNGISNCRNLIHDASLDLAFNRSPNSRRRGTDIIPLDLPLSSDRSHRSGSSDLPPCDLMEGACSDITVQREETYGPHNEPEITRDQALIDKMQTLPDFLSDGPIYSGRLADVANIIEDNTNQSIVPRLQQENERLRQDLEEGRRIILDLEQQINHAKSIEAQYNVVEVNLFDSNQRAVEAHAQAKKYKDQVRQLILENQRLKRENETLREGCGAVGGAPLNLNRDHIARDLKAAATSAESNLRQLLAGVENLRVIANSIENVNQFTSTNSDESDENEGPAL